MARQRSERRWTVRRFVVVEESMLPVLAPGDGVLALRGGSPRTGQVRVFPNPKRPGQWLIKRVGQVFGTGATASFEACSDNASAPGVVDSRRFGPVPAAGSYRVVWSVRP